MILGDFKLNLISIHTWSNYRRILPLLLHRSRSKTRNCSLASQRDGRKCPSGVVRHADYALEKSNVAFNAYQENAVGPLIISFYTDRRACTTMNGYAPEVRTVPQSAPPQGFPTGTTIVLFFHFSLLLLYCLRLRAFLWPFCLPTVTKGVWETNCII